MKKMRSAAGRKVSPAAEAPADRANPMTVEEKLLAAAEALIIEQGFHRLRTRAIAARAGVNLGMIRYCFGGIDGLLRKLLLLDSDAYIRRQLALTETLGRRPSLEDILLALLAPLDTPAAFTPNARASTVLHEVMPCANASITKAAEERLHKSFIPLVDRLVEACPHLTREAICWRLCCVLGGANSLYPRAPGAQLFLSLVGHYPPEGPGRLDELIATAAGALSYRPAR